MKIYVPNRYAKDLSSSDYSKIMELVGIDNSYYELIIEKRNGRSIIIEHLECRNYIIFSAKTAKDGRNTFLNQYISTVLSIYGSDESTKLKNISVYLMDTSSSAKTPYMLDTYRILKTLDIGIINEHELNIKPIKKYQSVREFKVQREDRQNYNPANNSSYILENSDSYEIFGKSFGANGKESALISCLVSKIASAESKKVLYYQVEDNGSHKLSNTDKVLLENYGVIIDEELIPSFSARNYIKSKPLTSRNQAVFHFNLLNKYGKKKCLLCGNQIEATIIASHIHRITDIDKSNVSWEEKIEMAVDSDNGLWLCSNHDKLFENGLIFFEGNKLEMDLPLVMMVDSIKKEIDSKIRKIFDKSLRIQISDFVSESHELLILENFFIDSLYYSEKMKMYLDIHKNRFR